MDSLLSFYPTILCLQGKLSFQELKSLSSVSRSWWEVTNSFIIKRGFLNVIEKQVKSEIRRNYKQVRVDFSLSIENPPLPVDDTLLKLPESVENLELKSRNHGWKFGTLKRFKKLKSLNICQNGICKDQMDLVLGLEQLEVIINETNLDTTLRLIRANGAIKHLKIVIIGPEIDDSDYNMFVQHDWFSQDELDEFFRNIRLPNLRHFSLEMQSFSYYEDSLRSGLSEFFRNHRSLEVCDFCDVDVSDIVIQVLRENCENLERISLCDCTKLTGDTLIDLKSMKKLKHLDLAYTSFPMEDLVNLNLSQLQSLNLSSSGYMRPLTTLHIQTLLRPMGNLRILDLSQERGGFSYNLLVNSRILPFIAEHLPSLLELNLSAMFSVCCYVPLEDKVVFKKLEKLDMSSTKLPDDVLCLIYAPKLRAFNMSGSKVSTSSIKHLVSNSPWLENLNLSYSTNINETDIKYVTEHLSLKELVLDGFEINENLLKHLIVETSIEDCTFSIKDPKDLAGCQLLDSLQYFHTEGFKQGKLKLKLTNGVRNFWTFVL